MVKPSNPITETALACADTVKDQSKIFSIVKPIEVEAQMLAVLALIAEDLNMMNHTLTDINRTLNTLRSST